MSQFKLSKRKKCKTCSDQSLSSCDNDLYTQCTMEQRRERGNYGNGKKIINISIFVAILINYLAVPCSATDVSSPTIIPSDSVTLDSGEDLRLTCHGDKPLKWKNRDPQLLTDPRVNVTSSAGDLRKYTSTLTLYNVTGTDAGEFICSYSDNVSSNSDDETSLDYVIVWIIDENNLLARIINPFVQTFVGSNPVLPCRPSFPDVQIEILDHYNKKIKLTRENYSIKKGLTLKSVKLSDHGTWFTCIATYKNRENSTNLRLGVIAPNPAENNLQLSITDGGWISIGDEFTVVCSTEQKRHLFFKLNITTPIPNDDPRVIDLPGQWEPDSRPNYKKWVVQKVIKGAKKEDAGNYTCSIDSGRASEISRTKTVKVYDKGESFLDAYVGIKNITARNGVTARWIINITSYPIKFDYSWQNKDNEEVGTDATKFHRFRIANTTKPGEFMLEINRVTLQDMGPYKFHVYLKAHPHQRKTLDLYLTVKSPPILKIESDGPAEAPINCMFGQTCTISCKVEANPPPQSYWTWRMCNSNSICEKGKNVTETYKKQIEYGFVSSIEFNGTHHGKYTCHANNGQTPNEVSITKRIRIVDYPGTGAITIIKPEEVVEEDDLKLVCVASKFDYDENITWVQADGTTTKPVGQAKFTTEETKWSRRNTLEIKNIDQSATGTYRCTTGGSNPKLEASYHLDVLSIASPQFLESTNLNNSKVSVKVGESKELICNVSGRPKPVVTWTWDEHPMKDWENVRELKELTYSISDDNRILLLKYFPAQAEGRFQCSAENRNGTVTAFLDIAVTGSPTFSNVALAVILALFLSVVIFGAIVARYKYRQGAMNRFLKEIKQQDFYNGAVENINPEMSVTDQAYLLPFDSRWEFPKERLKLGFQLGAGAFGRVVKADAIGILENEQKTTVAVKMVKPNADESHFKALMSELKIMVHLGKHINVVNLLGACTRNLAKKKELFVIVEYCKYGSLLSYMHRNKRTFINQLDPARGIIDTNIDRPIDRNSAQSQAQRTLHYAQLTFMDAGNSRKPASNGYRTLEEFNGPNLVDQDKTNSIALREGNFQQITSGLLTPNRGSMEHYVPESQVESVCTGISYLSNGPVTTDGTAKRRSSCGSQWQDHYRGDYQAREVQPIRTTDLLCWAFQISRGMEYLASRKVLHGDLAARNVLLAENNVVKICDFGLAKEMYKDYKYKKKSEGVLLPVKWMAIESIYYGLFSTQSDCWSFGVVLWELFTLGKTPYPGMEADEKFYKRISEGYRMEKPPLAPSCVYDIMLECWAQEPTERPTFSALVDRIGDMMEEGLRNHYVDLNAPYMRINQEYIMSGQTDYLLKMGKTEYNPNSQRTSPERKYQNVPDPEELDSAGYLMPNPPPLSPTSPLTPQQPQVSPQYKNIDATAVIHQPRLEAHNDGYRFLNIIESPEQPPGEQLELQENKNNALTLQIEYSPQDIKDVYGLRDSYSPDRNSTDEDDSHINLKVGDNGIKGVDNMNYVPNHMLFNNKPPGVMTNGPQTEPQSKLTNGGPSTESSSRRQKRQKNDSGLGSIDSTHFDNHHNSKYNNHNEDLHTNQCVDFSGSVQGSNGYVTNITSLS